LFVNFPSTINDPSDNDTCAMRFIRGGKSFVIGNWELCSSQKFFEIYIFAEIATDIFLSLIANSENY
jgi:hypothetical protein